VVALPLDIVQDKYCAVARRQLPDAALETTLSTDPSSNQIWRANIDARRTGFIVRSAVASIETVGGDFLRRRISTEINGQLCCYRKIQLFARIA